jgi:hypothetical protein
MVETLGYTEEELLMHPFLDFVHADDKENTQKKLRRFEKALTLEFKIDGFVKTILLNGLFGLHSRQQLVSCIRRPRYYRTCKIRKRTKEND